MCQFFFCHSEMFIPLFLSSLIHSTALFRFHPILVENRKNRPTFSSNICITQNFYPFFPTNPHLFHGPVHMSNCFRSDIFQNPSWHSRQSMTSCLSTCGAKCKNMFSPLHSDVNRQIFNIFWRLKNYLLAYWHLHASYFSFFPKSLFFSHFWDVHLILIISGTPNELLKLNTEAIFLFFFILLSIIYPDRWQIRENLSILNIKENWFMRYCTQKAASSHTYRKGTFSFGKYFKDVSFIFYKGIFLYCSAILW